MTYSRSDVLDFVSEGEWSPAKAEKWVEDKKYMHLSFYAPIEQYDPMEEIFGNLLMTFTWICTRKLHVVRRVWKTYIDNCLDWTPVNFDDHDEGYELCSPYCAFYFFPTDHIIPEKQSILTLRRTLEKGSI